MCMWSEMCACLKDIDSKADGNSFTTGTETESL